MPSALLAASTHRLAQLAQVVGDVVVLRRTGRRAHRPRRPPRRPRPRPAGSAWPSPCRCRSRPSGSKPPVSMTMNSCLPWLAVAVVAVARQAGEVGHDGVARLGQAVEQRRLADVGAADQGHDGFHREPGSVRRYSGTKPYTPPLRVTTTRVLPATHRRGRDGRAVGGQAVQQRCRPRATASARRPSLSPTTTERPSASGAVRPRYSSRSVIQARSPLSRRQATTLPSASVPNTSSRRRRARPRRRRVLGPQQRCRARRRRSPRGLEGARADRCRRRGCTLPTRSTRRSTSLVPRGVAIGASQRTLPLQRVRGRPGGRPGPTTSVSPRPACTPAWRSTSGSPGRCCVHRRAAGLAVEGVTERSAASTNTRPPATSGAV